MDVPVIGAPRPAISVPPWTVLGYRADGRPIYPIAGGSEDDGGGDVDMGDEGGDDEAEADVEDVDDTEPDAAPAPKPSAKTDPAIAKAEAELVKLRAALKKSNDDAKRHRLALKEREDRDRANEGDAEKAIREAREEAETRWKPRIVNQTARAALAEAGIVGGPERVLKLLDLDALSVTTTVTWSDSSPRSTGSAPSIRSSSRSPKPLPSRRPALPAPPSRPHQTSPRARGSGTRPAC